MAADKEKIDKHISKNAFRDNYYRKIGFFGAPPHNPNKLVLSEYLPDLIKDNGNGSSSNSLARSDRESSKGDLATISYVEAYIAVYQETTRYYEDHPNLSENYKNYTHNEQFVGDKKDVLNFLKELDQENNEEPSNNNDHYYQNSPSCLKKLWAATKILCAEYQGRAEFSRINSHLQGFVIHYHPAAHHSPKEAGPAQIATTPEKLELPQPAKEDSVLQVGALFSRSFNQSLSSSLPNFPSLSVAKDGSDKLSRSIGFR